MNKWHTLTQEEVVKQLETGSSGLPSGRIAALQQQHGPNRIEASEQKSKWAIFASQFKDVMILILVVAAVISFSVGERIDAYVILAIIFGNALIGFYQENNAEESVRMLQKMTAQYAMVLRDGKPSEVETKDLVPGDIILLEAGDIVPADARLLEVSSLRTEEAALTGESHSVEKNIEPIEEENLLPGDQYNMVFKSTIVSNGSAKAVVTSTGMNTEIGKIAGLLEVEDQKTPLQKRLDVFSKQLAVIVILICLAVFGFGLWRGEPPFVMFLTALSLAVAALPEALPAVITISLAQGARRMVKQKALVRVLPAVETLGSVTYICSDKTGTLTQNVMTVEKTKTAEGKDDLLHAAMMLTNEVRFSDEGVLGDSTETALVNYVRDRGLSRENMEKELPMLGKLPFDSERMRMSTLHQYKNRWLLLTKGAPVKVTEVLSAAYDQQKEKWLGINREWAADGLRVLFFSYRILDEKPATITEELESEMEFLGIAAMIDPPREEVIDAIRECKTAGIKSVMITGDQPLTAYAIAERLQLIDEDSKGTMTGAELEKLSEDEYRKTIQKISVYARVSPAQKMKIVKTLQDNGQFVAMTGDGVNDAPSLKQADIGVAMGITGTDVSKEAADLILLDDNFATIVKAVREGRRIYENIKKFILYILSCNIAEILTIVFAPVFGLAIPLLPIHILWINLVTDGLPGIALASEPAEEGVMQRPPRSPNENLFAGGLIPKILGAGMIMAAAAIIIQSWAARRGYGMEVQQTMVFTTLCFVQLGNAMSVRFSFHSILNRKLFANWKLWGAIALTVALQFMLVYIPGLHPIFSTTALDSSAMGVIALAVICSMAAIELLKFGYNKATQG